MNKILLLMVFIAIVAGVGRFLGDRDATVVSTSASVAAGGGEECPPMEQFMRDHPDATPEEIYAVRECNRKRAAALGLDRRGTGFLGNRNIRPEGALAHYEGGYGSLVFTLYEDRISAKDAGDDVQIDLRAIRSVEKSGNSIYIVYRGTNGRERSYGISLFSSEDDLKSPGNTDLDRLVDLINELRG